MLFSALVGASALCSIHPAILFCINLRRFRPPAPVHPGQCFAISVLIPARNEEANIGEALRSVLASRDVDLEVLVWDDDSDDRTAEVVLSLAEIDPRVRLLHGTGLPPGWNGKQHACWHLAHASSQPILVFLDADVRVEPDLLARMTAFRAHAAAGLVSGFPRLITITWLEKLLLPLIHFILLAFLPMRAMRRRTWASAAAGCGQFLLAEREAYFASGGHSAIRETMHDGLLLPRVFRRMGYRTDIADITQFAHVRMYDAAAKVWQGLAKNATEGIAAPARIVPLSLVLLVGQVVPALFFLYIVLMALVLTLFHFWPLTTLFSLLRLYPAFLTTLFLADHGAFLLKYGASSWKIYVFSAAILGTYLPRLLAVRRFQQPLSSALFHPVGVLILLTVQWYALTRKMIGRPVGWRQRTYSSQTGTELGS